MNDQRGAELVGGERNRRAGGVEAKELAGKSKGGKESQNEGRTKKMAATNVAVTSKTADPERERGFRV